MKRIVSLILVALLTLSLVACSNSGAPASTAKADTPAQTETKVETKTETKQEPASQTNAEPVEDTSKDPKFIRIVSGSMGGNAFVLANAIAQLINEKMDGVEASAQATSGSSENCRLLEEGEAEMAVNQSLTTGEAIKGKGSFDEPIGKNFRSIGNIMFNSIHIMVYNNANIKSIEDLRGRSVGVGPVGGAHESNAKVLLAAYGMTFDDIKPIYGSINENLEAIKNGEIDATMYTTPFVSSQITDVMGTGKVSLIGMSEAAADICDSGNDEFGKLIIPANTYPNQTEALWTVATPTIVIVSAEWSDTFVYNLTKLFFENQEFLMGFHKNFGTAIPENVNTGRCIPMHNGAIKYLKEIGIEVTAPFAE